MNGSRCTRVSMVMAVAAVITILLAGPLGAAEPNGKAGVFTLGEVEVTAEADRYENPVVDWITNDEMRLFNADTIAEAVKLLPGVAISRVGARNETMISIRGFDLKHVPLFLDGIPIYVPYDGYPDLDRFYTFDLSQVVVSKGFTSVLYGPDTMGGAINMISRKPEKKLEGSLSAGFASGNTHQAYVNAGTNQKLWYFQVSASDVDSGYYRLSGDWEPMSTENGGKRENSYHRDQKVSAKVGFTPNSTDEYAFSYINQHGVKGVPPYAGTDPSTAARYWRWPSWDKESYYFTSNTAVGGASYVKARLYYDTFKNSLFAYDDATYSTMNKRSSFRSYYDDYTVGGSLEAGTRLVPYNDLKFAFHYKQDVHREHNAGSPTQHFRNDIMSFAGEDTIKIGDRFSIIAGVSYDVMDTKEAEDYDSNTGLKSDFPKEDVSAFNPQIGLFYKFTDTGTAHISASRKTRLPSIKDKYSFRLGTALPNPDLDAEKSINFELGYQDVFFHRVRTKATVFYSDISDYIINAAVPDPDNPSMTLNQNKNIGDVDQYGVELDVVVNILSNLEAGFNYTYLEWDNKTDDSKITNVPHHKFFFYARYSPIEKLTLLADLEYDSKRYTSTDGKRVADGYTIVNAKAVYEIIKGLELEAGVNNIFDENYAIDEGFPEPGINAFTNLTYHF